MNGKHHFLPQFYLRGFCNEQNKLIVCRTEHKSFNEFSTAAVYYKPGLNDVVIDGNVVAELETEIYQDWDDHYSKEFKRVLEKYNRSVDTLSFEDKKSVVEFVLNLYWRVPTSNQAVKDLIVEDGLLTSTFQLVNEETGIVYCDGDIPEILERIKNCDETKKVFKLIFDIENRAAYEWDKLEERFHLIETNIPLIIGDIPFVPLRTSNERGKILEEFIFPFTANKLLVYADRQHIPMFIETNVHHLFCSCVIENSERVACNNKLFLESMMNKHADVKVTEVFMSRDITSYDYLAKFLMFESRFKTIEELGNWYSQHISFNF